MAVCFSLVASANTGCLLFSDPINTAPTVSITCSQAGVSIPCTPDQKPSFVRNKIVLFQAVATDPDQRADTLRLDWYIDKSCNTALAGPSALSGQYYPKDLGAGCVAVVVTDSQGASARAEQLFTVENQPPVAEIEIVTSPSLVAPEPGQPLMLPLYAKAPLTGAKSNDPDGAANLLNFAWRVYSGDTQITMSGCPDPSKEPYLCTFGTDKPGNYRVQLVVSDQLEAESAPVTQAIQVAGEQLPNIVLDFVQPAPPFPPDDSPLQLLADLPNTFTINRVDDDGDPYPSADPTTPYPIPPAGFVWFVKTDSKPAFERLTGANGASYTIPVGSFSAQQSVRLRVEYHDRVTACQPKCGAVFAACDPLATICYSSDLRVQWVTWAVVFR
jgi:hypothetical protein